MTLAPTPGRPGRKTSRTGRRKGDVETDDASARPEHGTTETGITTAPTNCTTNAHVSPAKATAVSIPHRYQQAKAITVSDNRATSPTRPGCGGGFALHEALWLRVAGVLGPHVVQFPASGDGEAATRGGAAPKVQTTSVKNAENGLLWAKWSAFWAQQCLAWLVGRNA